MPDPEGDEARDVRWHAQLLDRLHEIGAQRLSFAQLDWSNLFKSAYIPGALPAYIARETETRTARRRQELKRMAARSGARGLLRALARVA